MGFRSRTSDRFAGRGLGDEGSDLGVYGLALARLESHICSELLLESEYKILEPHIKIYVDKRLPRASGFFED